MSNQSEGITDLTFSEHDPYCERCDGKGKISDWPIHSTVFGPQPCSICGPTATLHASGPKGLEEGLRKLRAATFRCLNCGQWLDEEDCPCPVGVQVERITTRVLVLDGQEEIDFGASDPECRECDGNGEVWKCAYCEQVEHLCICVDTQDLDFEPCPCRRHHLDGVDKVVLEAPEPKNELVRQVDVDLQISMTDNIATARESIAEHWPEVEVSDQNKQEELNWDRFTKACDAAQQFKAERDALVEALRELHSVVWGECPSLLNEDSGGDAKLDLEIRALLAKHDTAPEPEVEVVG